MRNDFGNLVGIGIFVLIFLPIVSNNCSHKEREFGQSSSSSFQYQEEGLDKVVKQLRDKDNFTIILYDMNSENSTYYHQYQILVEKPDSTFETAETDWLEVSESFFRRHIDNLGMEIAHKENGIVEKETAPAGYTQYVGNEQYGHWVQRDGGSFWEFYGKYMFMSSMFNLIARPIYRDHWYDYSRNYRGMGRTYYGPNQYYGTRGYTSTASNKSTWAKKPQSFKDNVRSRVSRSSSTTTRTSSNRSTYSNRSTSQTSRSGSRFSGTSSYRSRGGGFGGK